MAPLKWKSQPGHQFNEAGVPPKPSNDNKQQTTNASKYPGIQSSGDFIRGFIPPDYHIDGVAQKGYLYSTTAMTGTGKTAVLLLIAALTMLGGTLGDREVRKGTVVYFAGENPDDVRMRWIAMAHHLGFNPDCVDVHFIAGTFNVAEMFERITADVSLLVEPTWWLSIPAPPTSTVMTRIQMSSSAGTLATYVR